MQWRTVRMRQSLRTGGWICKRSNTTTCVFCSPAHLPWDTNLLNPFFTSFVPSNTSISKYKKSSKSFSPLLFTWETLITSPNNSIKLTTCIEKLDWAKAPFHSKIESCLRFSCSIGFWLHNVLYLKINSKGKTFPFHTWCLNTLMNSSQGISPLKFCANFGTIHANNYPKYLWFSSLPP